MQLVIFYGVTQYCNALLLKVTFPTTLYFDGHSTDYGCFHTCRSTALFRNRDYIIIVLLFILGAVCFHTAKFLNGPNLLIQVTRE